MENPQSIQINSKNVLKLTEWRSDADLTLQNISQQHKKRLTFSGTQFRGRLV